MNYVLDEAGTPRPEPDLLTWARWYETNSEKCRVALTEIGDVHVSTVFLATDHNWLGGPPILYETMVFGGPYDGYQWRHHTATQALAEHDQISQALRNGERPGWEGEQ